MAGTKGMKWSRSYDSPYKINASVDKVNMESLLAMAETKRWSLSQCVREIIKTYFQNEERISKMLDEMYQAKIRQNWSKK